MERTVQGLIEFEEGKRNSAYLDTLGVPTIGVGHTGPEVYIGLSWTDDQIAKALDTDIQHAADGLIAVLPWITSIDSVRFAYLISMAFQLGVQGVLQFKNTLGAIRDQRWNDAAGGIRASLWHSQTFSRAERCARAMETGEWQS